ncbi:MAG: hypothetical protein MZV64_70990 [Ignavibacteriales bacterium]|nr:hypothetical protein [Ignavibacteriales bacterium]
MITYRLSSSEEDTNATLNGLDREETPLVAARTLPETLETPAEPGARRRRRAPQSSPLE